MPLRAARADIASFSTGDSCATAFRCSRSTTEVRLPPSLPFTFISARSSHSLIAHFVPLNVTDRVCKLGVQWASLPFSISSLMLEMISGVFALAECSSLNWPFCKPSFVIALLFCHSFYLAFCVLLYILVVFYVYHFFILSSLLLINLVLKKYSSLLVIVFH